MRRSYNAAANLKKTNSGSIKEIAMISHLVKYALARTFPTRTLWTSIEWIIEDKPRQMTGLR